MLAAEKGGVSRSEIGPLFGEIIKGEDGRNGTNRHTRAAIDAFYRVDVQHLFAFKLLGIFLRVYAVDGTGIDTGCVFCANARFSNYVSHGAFMESTSGSACRLILRTSITRLLFRAWSSEWLLSSLGVLLAGLFANFDRRSLNS